MCVCVCLLAARTSSAAGGGEGGVCGGEGGVCVEGRGVCVEGRGCGGEGCGKPLSYQSVDCGVVLCLQQGRQVAGAAAESHGGRGRSVT